METVMDYKTKIEARHSVRAFKDMPIKEKDLKTLEEYGSKCRKLDDTIKIRFAFLTKDKISIDLKAAAGYNGYFIDAPCYMVLLSESVPNYLENAGYAAEDMILKAVELGAATCWMTIEEGEAGKPLGLGTAMGVAAVIALGYEGFGEPKLKITNTKQFGKGYANLEIRETQGDHERRIDLEQLVYLNEWGKAAGSGEIKERGLLPAFQCARSAPSALNRQPWRFLLDDGLLMLAIIEDKCTGSYEARIDAGIIMLHFAALVSSTLFELKWELGRPKKKYEIPANAHIVAYCNI